MKRTLDVRVVDADDEPVLVSSDVEDHAAIAEDGET